MMNENKAQENKIENPYVKLWKEDGIVHCVFAEKLDVTLEVAQHCVKERIAFSEGVSYPCLIDMRGIKSVSKEARAYMEKEGSQLIKAGALLTKSALTKMLVNIFLTLNKPKVPTKLFSDEADAKAWIKQYV